MRAARLVLRVRCGILQTCVGRCKVLRSRLTSSERGQGDRKARLSKRALPTSRYFSSSRLYVLAPFQSLHQRLCPLTDLLWTCLQHQWPSINFLTANARPCTRAQ